MRHATDVFESTGTRGYTVYTNGMQAMATPFRRLRAMLSPPGTWLYRDAHYLVAEMDVDRAASRRWLPRSLKLAEPATASIFTAWFPHTSFGSVYSEAGLFLHVEHRGTPAIFSPWMLVDDDVALILGRELLGYPKKLGTIRFEIEGDRICGVASRRSSELIRMEGVLGARITSPPPFLGRAHRNVRTSLGLAIPKVIAFTPKEEAIEVRHVDLSVTIGESERDPIADLGFGRVRAARLHRVNIGARSIPVPVGGASPLWFLRSLLLRAH